MKHLRKFNENKTDDIREFISDNLAFILDKDFAFDLSQSRYDDGNVIEVGTKNVITRQTSLCHGRL
jgi:hypothetical protein